MQILPSIAGGWEWQTYSVQTPGEIDDELIVEFVEFVLSDQEIIVVDAVAVQDVAGLGVQPLGCVVPWVQANADADDVGTLTRQFGGWKVYY